MTKRGLHTLALVALAAVSTAGIGCGGGSRACSANVTAEWFLTDNGVEVDCLPGDEVDINVGSMSATFACAAGAGTTPALVGGVDYDISLTLFDASGASLSQSPTDLVFVPCGTITDFGLVEFSLSP